jgi:hypothetical protein
MSGKLNGCEIDAISARLLNYVFAIIGFPS